MWFFQPNFIIFGSSFDTPEKDGNEESFDESLLLDFLCLKILAI